MGRARARRERYLLRATIVLVVAATIWFGPWLAFNLDLSRPWLSIPFAAAFVFLIVQVHVAMFNNWTWDSTRWPTVAHGHEPEVAVVVPTCGESPAMVRVTVESLISQDWPLRRLVVVVSDDGHDPEMSDMVQALRGKYRDLRIHYRNPPPRGSAARRGEAKSGNLNSVLDFLDASYPEIEFIETRDADDEVGDPKFLRNALAPLLHAPRTAYVQTIKECKTSPGDPFNNREIMFYRGAMLGKQSANAVFPCGSGLVWRRRALDDIGGFPTWNLVEDLQSGVEALKRGWRGVFVPIVGAYAQHSPEDLANVYKQRGTWALDTVRLLVWRSLKGMNLRQRLQFLEMGMYYMQGFPLCVLVALAMTNLISGTQPVDASPVTYMLHFTPYVVAVELFILVWARNTGVNNLLTVRRMWNGMMFVHMRAVVLAVFSGPNRKPTYKVTRKENVHRWYWQSTLPHFVIVVAVLAALAVGFTLYGPGAVLRPDTLYWTFMTIIPLGAFIPLGWYGARSPLTSLGKALGLSRNRAIGATRRGGAHRPTGLNDKMV